MEDLLVEEETYTENNNSNNINGNNYDRNSNISSNRIEGVLASGGIRGHKLKEKHTHMPDRAHRGLQVVEETNNFLEERSRKLSSNGVNIEGIFQESSPPFPEAHTRHRSHFGQKRRHKHHKPTCRYYPRSRRGRQHKVVVGPGEEEGEENRMKDEDDSDIADANAINECTPEVEIGFPPHPPPDIVGRGLKPPAPPTAPPV